MNTFKRNIIKDVQELQKLGACKNHNAVEQIIAMDLTEYEEMSVTDATDVVLAIIK